MQQTARNWLAALWDLEVAAMEAQDGPRMTRLQFARRTHERFLRRLEAEER